MIDKVCDALIAFLEWLSISLVVLFVIVVIAFLNSLIW